MREIRTHEQKGTSWMAIACGWLTMVGVAALLTPVVAAQLAAPYMNLESVGAAVPPLIALAIAAFIGGYASGHIAGHQTSWHGMVTAFFSLFVTLGYMLMQTAATNGVAGLPYYAFPDYFPGVLTVTLFHSQAALAFGLLMAIPVQILSAWLGGLLAPTQQVTVATPARPARTVTPDGSGLQPSR